MRQRRASFAGIIVLTVALAACGESGSDGTDRTAGKAGRAPAQAQSAVEAARRAQSVDLPPLPGDRSATEAFLQGDGRVLVDFHRIGYRAHFESDGTWTYYVAGD